MDYNSDNVGAAGGGKKGGSAETFRIQITCFICRIGSSSRNERKLKLRNLQTHIGKKSDKWRRDNQIWESDEIALLSSGGDWCYFQIIPRRVKWFSKVTQQKEIKERSLCVPEYNLRKFFMAWKGRWFSVQSSQVFMLELRATGRAIWVNPLECLQ